MRTALDIRSAILAAQDIKPTPVATPEWPDVDGVIHVRTMTGKEREAYLSLVRGNRIKTDGKPDEAATPLVEFSRIFLVVYCACTENNELLFTPEDVAALAEKNSQALEKIIAAASALNGFGKKAEEERKNDSPSAKT